MRSLPVMRLSLQLECRRVEGLVRKDRGGPEKLPPRPHLGLKPGAGDTREHVFHLFQDVSLWASREPDGSILPGNAGAAKLIGKVEQKRETSFRPDPGRI